MDEHRDSVQCIRLEYIEKLDLDQFEMKFLPSSCFKFN